MSWFAPRYDPIQCGSIDGSDTHPHDRGLVRALHANYAPDSDRNIVGKPHRTLFIGRLDRNVTTEDTLRTLFSSFGRIEHLRLVRDVLTLASKGYAFLTFESSKQAEYAQQKMHRAEVDGRRILVDFERARTMEGWVPRRFGGGLGGRKESGQMRFGGIDHPFKLPIDPETKTFQEPLERQDHPFLRRYRNLNEYIRAPPGVRPGSQVTHRLRAESAMESDSWRKTIERTSEHRSSRKRESSSSSRKEAPSSPERKRSHILSDSESRRRRTPSETESRSEKDRKASHRSRTPHSTRHRRSGKSPS